MRQIGEVTWRWQRSRIPSMKFVTMLDRGEDGTWITEHLFIPGSMSKNFVCGSQPELRDGSD
jgi:hypothetical protein